MRLMEDFLDLAKENTEKDLETCGILGAFLVRIILMQWKLLNWLVCWRIYHERYELYQFMALLSQNYFKRK